MSMFLTIFIAFLFGCAVGWFIHLTHNHKRDGLFILDDSDPNVTRWILDMKMDPEEIKNKKEIHLKVCKMEEEDV